MLKTPLFIMSLHYDQPSTRYYTTKSSHPASPHLHLVLPTLPSRGMLSPLTDAVETLHNHEHHFERACTRSDSEKLLWTSAEGCFSACPSAKFPRGPAMPPDQSDPYCSSCFLRCALRLSICSRKTPTHSVTGVRDSDQFLASGEGVHERGMPRDVTSIISEREGR